MPDDPRTPPAGKPGTRDIAVPTADMERIFRLKVEVEFAGFRAEVARERFHQAVDAACRAAGVTAERVGFRVDGGRPVLFQEQEGE